jgi:ABC-2 type transport system ATP-binding protein
VATILEINSLSKQYGKFQAVNKLNLEIESQMIFGLLGPNGSGKTTTLGMLLGVIRQSGGTFSWFGNGEADVNRKRIGALLETPNFYPFLTPVQNLEIVAKIKGMKNPGERIDEVLKIVDLYDRRDSAFKTFSLGMKQRLAIGSALLSDPEVLVLDEPTNGLDPQGIAEIRELIIEIGKGGKTIIIASHILDEIEKTCTHCAILRKGELLQVGTIEEIIGNQGIALIRVNTEDEENLLKFIHQRDEMSVHKTVDNGVIISMPAGTSASDVNKLFFENGIILSELGVFKESLENQFLEIVKKS